MSDNVERSHTEHMINLFLQGIIYDSMGIEVISQVMSECGLATSLEEAKVAYENCWRLGYPRGGNPRAWGAYQFAPDGYSAWGHWLER